MEVSFLDGLKKGFSKGKNPPEPVDCDYQPQREDGFEVWLRSMREEFLENTNEWNTVDYLLDQYKLHSQTRTPLDEHACGPLCDCEFKSSPIPDYFAKAAEGLVMRENPDEPPAGTHQCADSPYYDHLPQDCQAQPENRGARKAEGLFGSVSRYNDRPCGKVLRTTKFGAPYSLMCQLYMGHTGRCMDIDNGSDFEA